MPWLVHALATGSPPVILADGVILVFVALLFGFELRDPRRAAA